jgi:hypothetical protein
MYYLDLPLSFCNQLTSFSFSATGTTENDGRTTRTTRAPLVDSALLRFVSAEKKKQQQIGENLEKNSLSSIYSARDGSSINAAAATVVDEEIRKALSLSADQSEVSWMGQYNRNRIAQTLISLGVSEPLAKIAGEKVQDYVLVRMTRRRVLAFLRQRESLWRESNKENNSSKLSESEIILTKEPAHLNYGFDDVVKVLQDNGLTGTDICTILTYSPNLVLMMPKESFSDGSKSLSGGTLEETLGRSFHGTLMKTLGLRKYDARKVLRNCPGLLTARGSKTAEQVVTMMVKLGISTSAIARDKTSLPTLLSRSPSELFRLISFLSSGVVRMKIEHIGSLIRRKGSFELLNTVAPVHRLQRPVEREVDKSQGIEFTLLCKTREERKNRIDSVYKNMTKTSEMLRHEIGAKDLGKVIAAYPSVLLLDAEMQILPTAIYLFDELGMMKGELASALQQYPMLLGKDIDEMKERVTYLLSLGVKEDDLASIFRSFPALLTTDIETVMVPVVDYLQSIGVQDIGTFITKLPPVLGYSVEIELKPKWEYLKKVFFKSNFELEEFPAYFSYPFERVIKTRYDYLAAKGISTQLIPVAKVLRFGDKDFATSVARDEDNGKVFRAFSERRRKSKQLPGNKKRKRPQKKALYPKQDDSI